MRHRAAAASKALFDTGESKPGYWLLGIGERPLANRYPLTTNGGEERRERPAHAFVCSCLRSSMTKIRPEDHEHGFATRSVHAGQIVEPLAGAVMTPIYQTSTYVQQGLGKNRGYEYARTQNPTREALERNVASLEGATPGFAFASGLAALDAVLKLFKSGDHIVCGENVYGGSHRLMERIYGDLGLQVSFVDMRDITNIERALTPAT